MSTVRRVDRLQFAQLTIPEQILVAQNVRPVSRRAGRLVKCRSAPRARSAGRTGGYADVCERFVECVVLARTVLRDTSAGNHPLHRLTSQLRDPLIIGVVVQHGKSGSFRAGRDQQVWQRNGAMLRRAGQQRLHL